MCLSARKNTVHNMRAPCNDTLSTVSNISRPFSRFIRYASHDRCVSSYNIWSKRGGDLLGRHCPLYYQLYNKDVMHPLYPMKWYWRTLLTVVRTLCVIQYLKFYCFYSSLSCPEEPSPYLSFWCSSPITPHGKVEVPVTKGTCCNFWSCR